MSKAVWTGAALTGLLLSLTPAAASAAAPAHVRIVDACACGGDGTVTVQVAGRAVAQGLRYQEVSDYAEVGAGEQNIVLTGRVTAGLDADLDAGGYYTIVATGQADEPLLVLRETGGGSDRAAVVLHVVRSGDFTLPVQVLLDHGRRIAAMLHADEAAQALTVPPGTHELELYSLSGVLLGRVTCDLTAGQEVTVVLSGSPGGTPDLAAIAAAGPQIPAPIPAAPPPPSRSTVAGGAPASGAATVSGGAAAASATSAAPSPSSSKAAPSPVPAASPSGTLPKTGAGPLGSLLSLLAIGGGAALLRRRIFG